MPYFHLSPSCCIMCMSTSEFLGHLFAHCSFASNYWMNVLEALPNNICDLLSPIFVGHPFNGAKILLWRAPKSQLSLFLVSLERKEWSHFQGYLLFLF